MSAYSSVALVTLLSLLMYVGMAVAVARTRSRVGIQAPAMTGDAGLERAIRAHINTLEWLPIFLPSLWLFAIYWRADIAAALGVVWIIGRIVYFVGYAAAADKRRAGFGIQLLAAFALLFGAIGRIIYLVVTA